MLAAIRRGNVALPRSRATLRLPCTSLHHWPTTGSWSRLKMRRYLYPASVRCKIEGDVAVSYDEPAARVNTSFASGIDAV